MLDGYSIEAFLGVALYIFFLTIYLFRVVEYDEASTYAEENGLLFMETSAKAHFQTFFALLPLSHRPLISYLRGLGAFA